VVVLNIVTGDLSISRDDSVMATANWRTARQQYFGYCKKNDIEPATSRRSAKGARYPTRCCGHPSANR